MSINVIITFTASDEKRDAFTQLLSHVKTELPKEEGCEGVQIFNDLDRPGVFTLVERWSSREAHQRHIDTVITSGAWTHIASHLACDPVSGYFEAL